MTSPEVAVIGTGLIGTSVAMAALRHGSVVRGFDTDADVLARAVDRSGLQPTASADEALTGAALVFVCAPVHEVAKEVARAVALVPEAVVTDAGSVKASIVAEVAAIVGEVPPRFVGGHPMSGTERSGPDTASAALLDGATWVLTPSPETDAAAVRTMEDWITEAGAQPIVMDAEYHDRVVAVVSHLPQVASTVLMNVATREDADRSGVLTLAAGGFRDLTRLAASSPHLWAGIMRANREELGRAIDLFIEDLAELRRMLAGGEDADIERALESAKAARLQLATKPKVRDGIAILQVLVPDRPGVLAELTRALGEKDVNIEDMQIVHSSEGGRGSVQVTVAADAAKGAADALAGQGFDSTRIA